MKNILYMDNKYVSKAGMRFYIFTINMKVREAITQFEFCRLNMITLNLSCSMGNLDTHELTHQLDTDAR